MNKSKLINLGIFLLLACSRDQPIQPIQSTRSSFSIYLNHKVGNVPFALHKNYTTQGGDTFNVQKFKYYISNIQLTNAKNSITYIEDSSYHLIDAENNQAFQLKNVAYDTYAQLRFFIGVDSLHNHTISFLRDLNPNNEMAWTWNTGYKFMVVEGFYASNNQQGSLVYHIGNDINLKEIKFLLPNGGLQFSSESNQVLTINVNLGALFQNPNSFRLDTLNNVQGGASAQKIAENYALGMFSLANK
jgi:uncharacterized HAD superfamily protein